MNPLEFDRAIALGQFPCPQQSNFELGLTFSSEPSSDCLVAGVDEAGRGPLAGPVVAAAVILPSNAALPGLNDSKKVPPERRESLYGQIMEQSLASHFTVVNVPEIDALNILEASMLAMRRSIHSLKVEPGLVLVDGNKKPGSRYTERAIIKGDSKSAAIMAASIVAKVVRDQIMIKLHHLYPHYGFDENKGYGSKRHIAALHEFGPSPCHRLSFEPVKSLKKGILTTI